MEKPNLTYMLKLSDGDKSFETQLISILKTEFSREKKIFSKSISANDFDQTAEIVHKLKHKISILGLEKGYKLAGDYENNLRENNKSLTLEFSNVLDVISNYLKQI